MTVSRLDGLQLVGDDPTLTKRSPEIEMTVLAFEADEVVRLLGRKVRNS